MPKPLLILFSTHIEAAPSIKRLGALPLQDNLFEFDCGHICMSGIGGLSTGHALGSLQKDFSTIWNLGVAGSLHKDLPFGRICHVATVNKYLPHEKSLDQHSISMTRSLHPPQIISKEGFRLLSSDFPLHQKERKIELQSKYDLIDMEGYTIAYHANRWNKECKMWKWVSDFAEEGGPQMIKKSLSELSEKIAVYLEELLASKLH